MSRSVLVIVFFVFSDCGRLTFNAPDTGHSVTLTFPRIKEAGVLRITLQQAALGSEYELLVHDGDISRDFAHVLWVAGAEQRPSTTGQEVVVVFTCGLPKVRLAVDRRTRRPLGFAHFSVRPAESIRTSYGLKPDVDSLKWACSVPGMRAVHARYDAGPIVIL